MVKEEYIIFDKEELLDRLNGMVREAERPADDLREADAVIDYVPDGTLEKWKANVLNSLPVGASLQMAMDVENFLDTIRGVY